MKIINRQEAIPVHLQVTVTFSRIDRFGIVCTDFIVQVWSSQLGLCTDMWTSSKNDAQPESVLCVAINSAFTQLAVGSNLGCVRVFIVSDVSVPLSHIYPEGRVAIVSICWGTDNSSVLCSTYSGSLYQWSPEM